MHPENNLCQHCKKHFHVTLNTFQICNIPSSLQYSFCDFLVVCIQPSPTTEYSCTAFAFKDLKCTLPLLFLCTVSPLLTLFYWGPASQPKSDLLPSLVLPLQHTNILGLKTAALNTQGLLALLPREVQAFLQIAGTQGARAVIPNGLILEILQVA